MVSTAPPLWKTLRAPDLTPDALLAAMNVKAAPVDVEGIAKKVGARLLLAERHDSLGCLWFKGDKADLSVDRLAVAVRRRFTVATLLCHLLRHPEATYNRNGRPRSGLEEEALEFGSALLMPDQFLRPLLRRGEYPDPAVLAKKFQVSRQAMEMRLQRYEEEFGWRFDGEPEPPHVAGELPPLASDPWSVLGVPTGSPVSEVRAAYHRLLGQYHPDKCEHLAQEMKALAQQRTREIISAFEFIEAQVPVPRPAAPQAPPERRDAEVRHLSGEVLEVLKKARWWITNRGWCRGSRAKDGYGQKVVTYDSERAGQFSIVGAVWRAAGENFEVRGLALELVATIVNERLWFLENWNDRPERTKADVVQALDQAIRVAEMGTTEADGPVGAAGVVTASKPKSSSSG